MNYLMIDNLVFGGAERQVSYLINNNLEFKKIILLENEVKYEINNNKTIYPLHSNILKIFERPLFDNVAVNKLSKVFTSSDTVVSFLERSNIINIKSAINTNHRAIISVRNYLSERYKHPKYFHRLSLIKKYYPKADLIITNSQESKKDLILNFNIPEEKIKVIYNIIDLDDISNKKLEKLPQEHEHIFDKPVIINVGSLTQQKSQKQLIEAFSKIKKYHSDYRLVIIGKGRLKNVLINTAKQHGLESDVFLLGAVKNPFKYLHRSTMFVLNSNFEGFPNVLIESLSVGLPIVSKNCLSGPKELMEVLQYDNEKEELTNYGYIFPHITNRNNTNNYNREKELLAKSISNLIQIKENKNDLYQLIQNNCKKRAHDFSKELILKEWKKILNI